MGVGLMTDSSSASAPPSSASAKARSGGPAETNINPTKAEGAPQAFRSHFGLMLTLGKRYLCRHTFLVILYIATYLLGHSVLPAAMGLYAQKISNSIPVAEREASTDNVTSAAPGGSSSSARVAQRSELWLAYGLWLTATLAIAVMGLVFGYISAVLGGRVSNAIRQDLFAAVLRKHALFFHEHPSQQ